MNTSSRYHNSWFQSLQQQLHRAHIDRLLFVIYLPIPIHNAQVEYLHCNYLLNVHSMGVATPRGGPIIHQQKRIQSCFCQSARTSCIQVIQCERCKVSPVIKLPKCLVRRRHVHRSIVAFRSRGRFDTSRIIAARRTRELYHLERQRIKWGTDRNSQGIYSCGDWDWCRSCSCCCCESVELRSELMCLNLFLSRLRI